MGWNADLPTAFMNSCCNLTVTKHPCRPVQRVFADRPDSWTYIMRGVGYTPLIICSLCVCFYCIEGEESHAGSAYFYTRFIKVNLRYTWPIQCKACQSWKRYTKKHTIILHLVKLIVCANQTTAPAAVGVISQGRIPHMLCFCVCFVLGLLKAYYVYMHV